MYRRAKRWHWPKWTRVFRHRASRAYIKEHCHDLEQPPPQDRRFSTQFEQADTAFSPGHSSRLLALPPEVRMIIWEFTLGGRRLALFRDHGRLMHRTLDSTNSEMPGELFSINQKSVLSVARRVGGQGWLRVRAKPQPPAPSQILALPRTCRLIYQETISLLYSKNTFVLLQNNTLLDLCYTILPHRFLSIRSVHIHWQFREVKGRVLLGGVGELGKSLQPLYRLPNLENLSIFLQGPLADQLSYYLLSDIFRYFHEKTDKSFAARVPWPIPLAGRDWEVDNVSWLVEKWAKEMHIVQPPCRNEVERADRDTGFDTGWRVGTLLSVSQDGHHELETTNYAIYTP
ncbi:hypothetical protein K491DRAFT_762286 [Lophiostoma macrostomum CBS 122681]|uniref:DUF7730 domain-containing protein n=1 Tax=Lophiostoma macrostomum CBS 122681 TaxID=1314788 RepID=A0A6A6SQ30_9PLEO|nr:hypothetical protein K491DRAFT_762286 [Lophiostoma macrostomum CBS 122681]